MFVIFIVLINSRNPGCNSFCTFCSRKEIFSPQFAAQKLAYIHNNTVEAEIVEKAEEYIYSSPGDYYSGSNAGY